MPFFQNNHSIPFRLIVYFFPISEHRCMMYFYLIFFFMYLLLSHTRRKKAFSILMLWKYSEIARALSSASPRTLCYDLHHPIFLDQAACPEQLSSFSLLYIIVSSASCRTTCIFFYPCSMHSMPSWKHVDIPNIPHF